MIVLTGSTGQIGRRVLTGLLEHDEPVRVIVRDPARLPDVARDRVEVVQGSHHDRDVVDRALAGADALFWLMHAEPQAPSVYDAYVSASIPAADAVVAHHVPRVVTVSALGRGTGLYAGNVSGSLAMDDLFRSTGAHVRAVANPSFFDNVSRQVASLAKDGVLTGTLPGDLRLPGVATSDIAAAAAALLRDRTWTGQDTVDLLGPEDLSHDDLAAVLTQVLGRPVRYVRGERADVVRRFESVGFSPAMARAFMDMDLAKERGLDSAAVRTPESTTPTTFRRWATEVLRPMIENEDAPR